MDGTDPEADGLTQDQVRTLTEIGMMAAGHGMAGEANAIFESLRVLRPRRPFPYVGLAVTRLNAGKAEEAVSVLEKEGLAACPGDPDVRAFLGLALRLAGRSAEAGRVLQEVVDEHPEASAARLARSLLAAP